MIPIIKVDLIPKGRRNRPGYAMAPEYITIHQTGNTNPGADALMHARYWKGDAAASIPASVHYTVDDNVIYQSLPLNENGWHAGDGASGPGNRNSIAIEICINKGADLLQAELNAAWLCAKLIREVKTLKPFPTCMKQHYDWSGKNCPAQIRARKNGWSDFKAAVEKELKPIPGTPITGSPQATVAQAQAWAAKMGAHQRFLDIAPLYWHYGQLTGIRPEVLYVQSAKETAYGRYGGAVTPDQNNWCGVKTVNATGDRREDHQSFATPDDGVRAHFNHMCAYIGLKPVGTPHPRYYVVQDLSWAGTVRDVEALGGKWAPSASYGQDIVKMLAGLLAMPGFAEPDPDPVDPAFKLMMVGVYPTTVKIFPDTVPNGKTSIVRHGAENEILACQVALRSNAAEAVTVPVTITGGTAEIYEQTYVNTPLKAKWGFDQPRPCYPDGLKPLPSQLTLAAGQTKALWVRLTGDLTLKIGDQEIAVTVKHWPWELPVIPSLKTSIGLGGAGFARYHGTTLFSTAYWQHYKRYYDVLLDYRLSAYHLPFANINDPAARSYMIDPRVTTFRCEGLNAESWGHIRPTGKGWIYNFDEPTTLEQYREIRENAAGYHAAYPGIKYGIPFYTGAPGTDIYDYLSGAVNLWIPQTDYYSQTKNKAKARQNAGDELWLYTSWAPRQGWCNLMINQSAVEHRLLFWQLYAEGVTGFLYWHSTYWDHVDDPWANQATVKQSDPGIYGDGSLVYPGPAPSLRLELVREGMQDYELLRKAEALLGRGKVDIFVKRLTTALDTYRDDPELFERVRTELGEKVAGAIGEIGKPELPVEPEPPPEEPIEEKPVIVELPIMAFLRWLIRVIKALFRRS